jgi:hypothetical protein
MPFPSVKRGPGSKESPKKSQESLKLSKLKMSYYAMDNFMLDVKKATHKDKKTPFTKKFKASLSKEFKALEYTFKHFKIRLKQFLKTKSTTIPSTIIKAFARLSMMKNAFELKYKKIELKYRTIEERKAKAEYKKTSIERIKFRPWKKSDVVGFSKFVSEKASSAKLIKKLLKNNKYLWNPKGNPKLYFQQQCVEVAILLYIHYCFKNKINLALPAGGTHLVLSNFKTIEGFMGALYPRLAAVHLFAGAGGITTEIPENQVKPGDIYTAKHPSGGYHAQMVITNNKGKMQYLSGDQMNKDFRKYPRVRKKVEKVYPIGFAQTQPHAKPKDVKMKWGGYALEPNIRDNMGRGVQVQLKKKKDIIRYFRINPTKMNQVIGIGKITRK